MIKIIFCVNFLLTSYKRQLTSSFEKWIVKQVLENPFFLFWRQKWLFTYYKSCAQRKLEMLQIDWSNFWEWHKSPKIVFCPIHYWQNRPTIVNCNHNAVGSSQASWIDLLLVALTGVICRLINLRLFCSVKDTN